MVKETIDSLVYQEIVDGYLLPIMGTLYPEGWFLQQDNAPCHVSESSMAFFKKREIEVMDWPPNSPDLNPIENLWAILKKRLAAFTRTTVAKWKAEVEKEWDSISRDELSNLIDSMDRRIQSCIDEKGGHTKY